MSLSMPLYLPTEYNSFTLFILRYVEIRSYPWFIGVHSPCHIPEFVFGYNSHYLQSGRLRVRTLDNSFFNSPTDGVNSVNYAVETKIFIGS